MNYLKSMISTAAIVFAAATMYVGDSQYMEVPGVVSNAPTDLLTKYLPLVIGFIYPLLSSRFPQLASIVSFIGRFWKDNRDPIIKMLDQLAAAKQQAAKDGEVDVYLQLSSVEQSLVKRCKKG